MQMKGIDQSQWLPHGIPQVNAFRAAKGDIKRDGEAIKATHWMPDKLYGIEKLTKEHVDTCFSFYTILIGARRTLGTCDLRNIITDKRIEDPSASQEVDMFLKIIRGLVKAEANMLLWIVCDEYNQGNIALALNLIGTITHAIENTQIIIDNNKKSK